MKVLHVDTARSWRGGQGQVLLTARGMARAGHEVVLACRAGGALERRARDCGLDARGLPFSGDLSPFVLPRLARLVRGFGPDVVQLHDPHAIVPALLAGARARSRCVATRRVDFPLRGALSRRKYLACARVIAVSRGVARVLEASGIPAGRIRLVYEGVPDRPPVGGGEQALRALGVPPGSPVVGNLAALTGHKDHANLLAAAALVLRELPEARFVIAGEGELGPALERRAGELGLAGRVIFAGFRDDVDRLLPAFDVFCLSSRTEGLGTSLLDAMAFGRPIVATAAGGIPEAVADGVNGLVVPARDPQALAAALLELLRDPARRASLGEAGRQLFEGRFSAERMVEQTLGVYEELVASSA